VRFHGATPTSSRIYPCYFGAMRYVVLATFGFLVMSGMEARAEPESETEEARRSAMVDQQIEARGIRDPRVLRAMRVVPRHRFVPVRMKPYAYQDRPLPIGHDQTISQPYIVALMSELAGIRPGSRVLEVGTGSGYQAAVLAEMGAEVYSLEIVEPLAVPLDQPPRVGQAALQPVEPAPLLLEHAAERADAASFEVDCKALMHANGLRDSTPIRVGQQLAIPGRAAGARTVAAAERYYEVRQGDTPCEIAESFHVGCKALMRANGLADGTLLRIGQKLELPGRGAGAETVAGAAAEAERTVAAEEPVDVASAAPAPEQRSAGAVPPASGAAETGPVVELMEEIDVSVNVTRDGDATAYRIRVLPGETLGHYADWLGLGGTAALRRLNDLPYGTGLRLDTVVELPIDSDAERASFETSRFEYHQTLVDEFNQHYEVTDVRSYTVKLGDTMWKIARRHNLPYWVLSRANRDVSNPGVGETVDVPVIEARSEANQPLVDTN